MLRKILLITAVATAASTAGCGDFEPASPSGRGPDYAALPGDGSGTKTVIPIEEETAVTCPDGTVLVRRLEGWIQVHIFGQPTNRNIELDVFHVVLAFTSPSGEFFIFHEAGPDRFYVDGSNLVVAIVGRLAAQGIIGRLVIDLETRQVLFLAGQEFGSARLLACQNLTSVARGGAAQRVASTPPPLCLPSFNIPELRSALRPCPEQSLGPAAATFFPREPS